MAQRRDYVRCEKFSTIGTQSKHIRQHHHGWWRCCHRHHLFNIMLTCSEIAIFAILIITFIIFLNFKKLEKTIIVPTYSSSRNISSELPPKPQECWRYIKELEKRQIDVSLFINPSMGKEISSSVPLNNEQRRLLEHMQRNT